MFEFGGGAIQDRGSLQLSNLNSFAHSGVMVVTAADVLIETLIDWGVDIVFGLPGDGINGLMESLRTHQDQIRFIQVRHEESAAFMACAYAKFTGTTGSVFRDVRSRRNPSSQWLIRCQDGRPACTGCHRVAIS